MTKEVSAIVVAERPAATLLQASTAMLLSIIEEQVLVGKTLWLKTPCKAWTLDTRQQAHDLGVCWHWLQREQEKSLNAAGPLLVVSDFVISYRTFYGMDDLGRERLNQDSRFLHSFPDFLALALESPESLEAKARTLW